MKERKYSFDPSLKKYSHMRVPITRPIVFFAKIALGLVFSTRRSSKKITAQKIKIPTDHKKPINAILYSPKNAKTPLPCVLFLHGGGFVFKGAPHHYALAKEIAEKTGCYVLLPDYRVAPKFPFPAAFFDALSSYRWIVEKGEEYGINVQKTAVAGDSAGGNLAAAICLYARDNAIRPPKAQLLLYPVTDKRLSSESMRRFYDTPMCNSRDMKKYYAFYGDAREDMLPYYSPALAKNFADLPAAYIEIAEYDCLRDEGAAYAKALEQGGAAVTLTEAKGAMHGYDIARKSPLVCSLVEKRIEFLKRRLF